MIQSAITQIAKEDTSACHLNHMHPPRLFVDCKYETDLSR